MPESEPLPISSAEESRRLLRVTGIARRLGFRGRIQYRHEVSGTGGAQFGLGRKSESDVLIVDARAFQRDAAPDDFSLEAIIAHERGHQLLARTPVLQRLAAKGISLVSEEIVASLIGSIIIEGEDDRGALFDKAVAEAITDGMNPDRAVAALREFRELLEMAL